MRKLQLVLAGVGVAAIMPLGYVLAITASPTLASGPSASANPVAAGNSGTATPAAPPETLDQVIARRIPRRIDPRLFGPNYSIDVVDASTNETIFAANPDVPRLPASNLKLVTAFTALTALGPQSRVITRVLSLGGADIAIIGAGDATLSEAAVEKLAIRTRNAVLSRHLGVTVCPAKPAEPCRPMVRVHFVDSLFGRPNRAPGWPKSYVPAVASSVSSLGVLGDYSPAPAADATEMFVAALNGKRLSAQYSAVPVSGAAGTEIASVPSDTVSHQVAVMLQRSENNIAEILFRRVAIALGHTPDWAGGATAATQLLEGAGLPMSGVTLRDGSGLSRGDRVPATFFTSLLAKVVDRSSDPALASIYFGNGLPTSGETGTLGSRFGSKSTRCAVGKVRAKTGSLWDVVSLTGIAQASDGHPKLFSVLINSAPQDKSEDQIRGGIDRLVTTLTGCH